MKINALGFAAISSLMGHAHAQFAEYLNATIYPNEQHENATKYLTQARDVAGDDMCKSSAS